MILTSTLTCPHCGHRSLEAMPTDACVHFYQCAACGVTLTPKPGDCCVFCSYGDAPCPPVQEARSEISCCGSAVRARFRQDEEGGG
ncbi:MAG TPA: GDCCVxC domain-containing (seleno)protein [Rhodoblastus sp.]|nr:GDCCVxC domain-containing (seleno)protein [Rhodoblastus sp.]